MITTPLARTPRSQLDPKFLPAWDTLNRLTGEPAFVEAFAANPSILDFVMNEFYARVFFGGNVEQRYKQLARLELSLLHGCRTCNKQNVPGALEAGITQAQVDAMLEFESGPFTEAEKAVLAYAREVALTNAEGRMTPELHARLSRHFSQADILELGVTMAVISGMAKLSFVLDLVEKEPYCPFAGGAS
ncbi:MAG: carboxymuconolactone decarboxylase family protein [Steroidobacteraceae bacterium]